MPLVAGLKILQNNLKEKSGIFYRIISLWFVFIVIVTTLKKLLKLQVKLVTGQHVITLQDNTKTLTTSPRPFISSQELKPTAMPFASAKNRASKNKCGTWHFWRHQENNWMQQDILKHLTDHNMIKL